MEKNPLCSFAVSNEWNKKDLLLHRSGAKSLEKKKTLAALTFPLFCLWQTSYLSWYLSHHSPLSQVLFRSPTVNLTPWLHSPLLLCTAPFYPRQPGAADSGTVGRRNRLSPPAVIMKVRHWRHREWPVQFNIMMMSMREQTFNMHTAAGYLQPSVCASLTSMKMLLLIIRKRILLIQELKAFTGRLNREREREGEGGGELERVSSEITRRL